jgi:hypothetical protein
MNRLMSKKKRRSKGEGGQIFIESIVAISLAIVGLLGILILTTRSMAYNTDAGQRFVATYLAAEGIEIVKNLIDENYSKGLPWCQGISNGSWQADNEDSALTSFSNSSHLKIDADGRYSYDPGGTDTPFTREIVITLITHQGDDSTNEVKVNSIVRWQGRGVPNQVDIEDHFYDWRNVAESRCYAS